MKQKLKIFLSYATEEEAVAEQACLTLRNAGHDVFFDRTCLPPGRDYNPAILAEIRSSDLFVFLISPQSVQHGAYARTELRFARDVWPTPAGHILPVMAEEVTFDQIPNYLQAVTILRPEGSLAAELGAAVQDLQSKTSHEDTVAGQKLRLNEFVTKGKLEELDRVWEQERKNLLIKVLWDEVEPQRDYAWWCLLAWLSPGVFVLVLGGYSAWGAWVFLLIFACVGLLHFSIMRSKADGFREAEMEYETQRAKLLAEIEELDDQLAPGDLDTEATT